ncbi:MAG: hypothetical protein ACFCBU_00305 [Cyanophyceae cyanobacterium]
MLTAGRSPTCHNQPLLSSPTNAVMLMGYGDTTILLQHFGLRL